MKILITGDLCPINRTELLIDKKNYQSIFNDFLPVIQNADLPITNLESPITNHSISSNKVGPKLKAIPESVEALVFANFKLVTLANNHILDYKEQGLIDTIEILKQNKISFVGAGLNNIDARRPYIFFKEGIRVGILSIAENEWSTTQGNNAGAAPIDEINNFYDIQALKKEVNYIIVISHGGLEMYNLPSPRVKKLYRFFIDAGADIVVGHHTHCFSGFEIYNGKHIFYSLGNFVFDRDDRDCKKWQEGVAVEFEIIDEQIDFRLIPIIQNDANPGVRLMKNAEIASFNIEIRRLNSIIINDYLLNREFEDVIKGISKKYERYLQPYSNILLLGLFNRGILPNIWKGKKRLLLQNLISCETHKEILLKLLKNEI